MSLPPATSVPPTSSAGLPVVNQALEPAWVRHGSAATQKAYDSALAFEQTLVEQLSRSLTATSGLDGEAAEGGPGSEEGSAMSGAGDAQLSSLLPQALTSGVMNAGGLGLAAQMTRELESMHGGAQTQPSGGSAPAAASAGEAGKSGGSGA